MEKFISATRQFLRDEEGATAIEYGLIAALIAVAVIATVALIGTQLNTTFLKIKNCLVSTGNCT